MNNHETTVEIGIKNMMMPKNCHDCELIIDFLSPNLHCGIDKYDLKDNMNYQKERHPKCRLINLANNSTTM